MINPGLVHYTCTYIYIEHIFGHVGYFLVSFGRVFLKCTWRIALTHHRKINWISALELLIFLSDLKHSLGIFFSHVCMLTRYIINRSLWKYQKFSYIPAGETLLFFSASETTYFQLYIFLFIFLFGALSSD